MTYTHSLKRRYLFEHNTDHEFADYGTSLGFSRSSDMVDYYSQMGVVPNYAHCSIRNIKMKQKHEGAGTIPDCKGIPSFGPILMPDDLTFKEPYLCVVHKELLVREVIERVIAKNVPFEMVYN